MAREIFFLVSKVFFESKINMVHSPAFLAACRKREINKKDLKKNEKGIFHVDFTLFREFASDHEYRCL